VGEVILTGPEIAREAAAGRIMIKPFDASGVEPNSYGFHLGPTLLTYDEPVLHPERRAHQHTTMLPTSGRVLLPERLYLGHTREVIGSDHYAATLYACRSISTLGVWITFSAPLGHTGAVVAWTLEIRVAQPTLLYPGMRIGKVAFWRTRGTVERYKGRYEGSRTVVESRLSVEFVTHGNGVPDDTDRT
jgi:dCTP deaminase